VLPTTLLIEAEVVDHVSPATTVFPAVVGAASVHAEPEEPEVWLQFVLDAETKAMPPHAGVEQRRARSRIRRLVKGDTPRSWLCWSQSGFQLSRGRFQVLLFSWSS
jgi:hypothetical protein